MATGQAARSTRTIVIAGVPAGLLQDDVMADILTIHFQMSRNNGGDVEEVTYPTQNRGVAYITFEDPEVVESVLKKDQHLLQDKRLSRLYPLTLSRHCQHAFLCVTSTLSMAVFRHCFVLEDLVGEMKKQSPDLNFGPLQPDGRIAVQGSFPALRALREFLLVKAKSLPEGDKREGKSLPEGDKREGKSLPDGDKREGKSLPEGNKREAKSQQRPRRKQQEHRGAVEMRNSPRGAHRDKQILVLDTDIYHYMRCFYPKTLQAKGVVISAVPEGDITTLCIEDAAGSRAGAAQGLRAKKSIENCSVELQKVLRKERICLRGQSRAEQQRCRQLCERLQPRYPAVLLSPADTHIDVVGTSADVFGFTEDVKRQSR